MYRKMIMNRLDKNIIINIHDYSPGKIFLPEILQKENINEKLFLEWN